MGFRVWRITEGSFQFPQLVCIRGWYSFCCGMVRQGGGALQRRARSVGNVNETLIHHLKIEKNIQACNFSVSGRAPKRVG
jgi:hypothetical protein